MTGRNRKGVVLFFLCALAVSIFSDTARTQVGPSGIIEGTIVDTSSAALPGVAISLERPPTVLRTTYSNGRGQFRFDNVEPGKYVVRLALSGFVTTTREVSVASGQQVKTGRITMALGGLASEVRVTVSGAPVMTVYEGGRMSGRFAGNSFSTDRFNTEQYAAIAANEFRLAADHPLSTFSADVDTASYSNVRRFLRSERLPPPDAVRIEELINYFRFSYPTPRDGAPVSVTTEIGDCPWAPDHRLALIGVRARETDNGEPKRRNIVLLLDVSGSMAPADKLPLLQTALRRFADTLRADDRIAIVVYAGSSGLVLAATSGSDRSRIHAALAHLQAGGSTNGAEGIRLAYDTARAQFIPGGINRVILATDGDFNVGTTSEGELVRLIEQERGDGVFLSVLSVGTGNLKDATMEMLADKGNGTYAYLDSILEAERVLVGEGGATLETVAKDVKFQVEFNPSEVSAWKLIGYENRLLAEEDFNDDRKDAGDLGAGHTVTVLYEIVPRGVPIPREVNVSDARTVDPLRYQSDRSATRASTTSELFTVKVRYKQPESDTSRLLTARLDAGAAPGRHVPFAAAVAEFGLLLRDGSTTTRWAHLIARIRELDKRGGVVRDHEDFEELVLAASAMPR